MQNLIVYSFNAEKERKIRLIHSSLRTWQSKSTVVVIDLSELDWVLLLALRSVHLSHGKKILCTHRGSLADSRTVLDVETEI